MLKESGKKTHLLKRLTTSKKKLKKELKTEQGRIKSEKGTDIGQQVLGKGDVENVDKYSGVEEETPATYASPAKHPVVAEHKNPHPKTKKTKSKSKSIRWGGNRPSVIEDPLYKG